ncbi:MAG: EamA family transporter [Pseudomonadales bacterium]|nr:EamA family transporter [Pseudomonadales bacterium]
MNGQRISGILAALAAALLFGASTPLAKLLLTRIDPWLLAALLYLGSGVGLWLLRRLGRAEAVRLERGDGGWLAAAIAAGGVAAPLLLMFALSAMPATTAALLLNAEAVLTVLLAWFLFREPFDRRIAAGMLTIVAGALLLSWPQRLQLATLWPTLALLAAALAWAIDNNLTRKIALADASFIAMSKGLIAGSTNLLLALQLRVDWPAPGVVATAALLGLLCYGVSLTLFVVALRQLGAARTSAYFGLAPFWGALLAIALLGEPLTPQLLVAALLMAVGVALHLTERHQHLHHHAPMSHRHRHHHALDGDPHHDHSHAEPVPPGTGHSHFHHHPALSHDHPHFPDAHHGHRHPD